MDWIGDKLSMLIQEGKKALGREVVVMSDAKEDEVDDGTGLWEEETPRSSSSMVAAPSGSTCSRPGSLRRSRAPHALPLPLSSPSHSSSCAYTHPRSCPHSSPLLGTSSSARSDTPAGLLISPARTTRGASMGPEARSSPASRWEDESTWASPELRESMEKARARFFPS